MMMHTTRESAGAGSWGAGMISVFESAERAQEAIDRLERGGFDLSKLSVVGKEEPAPGRQLGVAVAGSHAMLWGQRAALWNRLADTPAALTFVWVPFIGYVVAVGPAAGVLIGTHWGTEPGSRTSALARMLTLAGMSPGELRTYEAAVRGGQLLVLVHGTTKELARARHLLHAAPRSPSGVA